MLDRRIRTINPELNPFGDSAPLLKVLHLYETDVLSYALYFKSDETDRIIQEHLAYTAKRQGLSLAF